LSHLPREKRVANVKGTLWCSWMAQELIALACALETELDG